jgi:thiosulfate dehydrogenase
MHIFNLLKNLLNPSCLFLHKSFNNAFKHQVNTMRIILIILVVAIVGIGLIFAWDASFKSSSQSFNKKAFKHAFVIVRAHELMGFNLVDPEQAPPNIRDSVMRGYRLVMYTGYYAPRYAHNELSCTNCHFCGGDTLGGKNGGISLVGVTTVYPQFSKRAGRVITLAERVNNCFQRSMNGNPLPLNSRMMNDILNYIHWISKEVETVRDIPWLGLPTIKSKHQPNPQEGQKIYTQYCAACHQADGQGGGELGEVEGKTIPPLWGPHSFNDGAGMNTMEMLAPFILLNMPYQQATLTEEQALDVAAFIRQQPRPHFFNH